MESIKNLLNSLLLGPVVMKLNICMENYISQTFSSWQFINLKPSNFFSREFLGKYPVHPILMVESWFFYICNIANSIIWNTIFGNYCLCFWDFLKDSKFTKNFQFWWKKVHSLKKYEVQIGKSAKILWQCFCNIATLLYIEASIMNELDIWNAQKVSIQDVQKKLPNLWHYHYCQTNGEITTL